jgi:tetratricopeptide (TPR) repeat protein
MAKLYVIRYRDGNSSTPLSSEQIIKRIKSGELKETDELSLYPARFALEVKDYPEFESFFRDIKSQPPQTPEKTRTSFVGNSDPTKSILIKTTPIEATTSRTSKTENPFSGEEKTELNTRLSALPENQKTKVHEQTRRDFPAESRASQLPSVEPVPMDDFADSRTASERTILLERPKELITKDLAAARRGKRLLPGVGILGFLCIGYLFYELLYESDEESLQRSRPKVQMVPIRPKLPASGADRPDPQTSAKIYGQGLVFYAEDHVQGYRNAAVVFHKALSVDSQNVKALALLASSYLNLIESSNKDEFTFSVIKKLIDLSSARQLELVETLLAEVEFLAVQGRYDAGIQRLVEYSKRTGKFDSALYFYLSWLYSLKNEYSSAMKYLNLIPASALKIPRLYYLRGSLHEENKEYDEASAEYGRALRLSKFHARSRLGLIRISEKKGELKRREPDVNFLVANPSYQSPKEYVESLIYRAKISLIDQNIDGAVKALEAAIEIDPKNETLRLEYYSLLSNSGKSPKYQKLAQMYALVLQGERELKAGRTHEAKSVFLQAQDAFSDSTVPFEKMGDLFYKSGEFLRAQTNYKKALKINPQSGELAIKLIDALIQNHEWEDAEKNLAKYRSHPKLKSSVDRLAGDLAFHQKNYKLAITFYRKAMSRDTIDTDVYSSYADVMREADECRDAQFFYSLAQRLDPFNLRAIVGSAKCMLKTDGIDTAVGRVQEELARLPKARADLLAGIAELYFLNHDDEKSLQFIQQAKDVDPDYPETYKVEGDLYLRQMVVKKDVKRNALDALRGYSDRKVSDPYGYLKRFEIFVGDSNFEDAQAELDKVFEVSPRFPELHYKRAIMYGKMGRTKDALRELESELKLNPRMDAAWTEQGNIQVRAGNLDEALKSYKKAMELNPKNALAKIGAGYANYLKRQYSSAIALYQSAMALDRGNPEIYKKMGLAYRDSGDSEKARQFFQGYLDLAPDAPDRGDFDQYRR